jgi:hypothetical protein
MTFWDGSRWTRELSTPAPEASRSRRVIAAVAEGGLISLFVSALLVTSIFAAQSGRQTFTLTYNGFHVWQEPYALADFTVTRTKSDGTVVWVKARCVDDWGAQAIPGADPYALVTWDSGDGLVGHAALDSVRNGTSCDVWLTKSIKSTGPAPGYPATYLDVTW